MTETIRGRIEKDNIILYTFLSPSYIYVLPWPKPIMLVIFYTCVACEHAHTSSSSSYGCRIIIGVCLIPSYSLWNLSWIFEFYSQKSFSNFYACNIRNSWKVLIHKSSRPTTDWPRRGPVHFISEKDITKGYKQYWILKIVIAQYSKISNYKFFT